MASLRFSGLLAPVVALNSWTFAMEVWMYATRIPAFQRIPNAFDSNTTKQEVADKTPPSVRWKADNYNHLMEQPTQFYAVALTLALAKAGDDEGLDVTLAWAYVGLRVVHSLVQSTTNNVMRRFVMFGTSSAVLATMTARAAMLLWNEY